MVISKISEKGLNLIKSFEGCRLSAYKCLQTEKYYTIGWGHYGPDVKPNQTITQVEADKLLRSDLKSFEEKVFKYDSIYHFNQNQFDALVSFCYNIGNIKGLTNDGKLAKEKISDTMLLYNKSGGKVINGLVRRRKAEKELFDTSTVPANKVSSYYKACNKNHTSIIEALKEVGETDTTLTNRKAIGQFNGIANVGTTESNIKMLNLLKQGKLKKEV